MRTIFTLLFSLSCLLIFAQDQQGPIKPVDLVESTLRSGARFESASPFSEAPSKRGMVTELDPAEVAFSVLDVNSDELRSLSRNAPNALTLSIPGLSGSGTLELDLVKVDMFTSDFEVTLASSGRAADVEHGAHYRGMISNEMESVVAISIFEDEIMGLIASDAGNLVLGKLKGSSAGQEHILYDDAHVMHVQPFECGVLDDGIGYKRKDLEWEQGREPGDCIRLYIEVDNDIYVNKGGATGTTNYITGLMNEVITLYANESISAVMSQLVLWDVTSPYSSTSSSGMLSDFQANISSINGDLGQLFSYQASGGIAAGFSGICNPNVDNSLCFSSINTTFAEVPTYSWSVMVATHEFGHLWGSRHTHACVWNGNNTAIDGCAGSTEGTCALPGYPSEGGTIMSYCHLQSVGINFNNGFGLQPGNVIRNSVDNATCTAACGPASCDDGIQNQDETGVDCGGSICPACPTCTDGIQNGEELGVDCGGPDCAPCPCTGQDVTLTIVLDNYPGETTWTITSGGLTYASGGPYSGAGSTVVEVNCLNDGCYDFTIFDSYGDGICCTYGSGSYLLEDASGNVLASGGAFGSSETTNFCLSSSNLSVAITNETNVSCNGGSDGSATAAASNGTSPYTYAWSNGGTGATVSGLSAGSYTVTVTDAGSNTATATATITEPAALTVSATGTDASCTGASDGSASASASGGTGSVSYAWSNGGTTATINNLAAGTYAVTVTDANGCTATDAVTIGENTPGTACDDGDACTINDVLDANCNCAGTFEDTDGDGVCDADDACPGFDDTIDTDGDGIPDGCDSNNCTPVTDVFPTDPLIHNGSGSSSTTLTYGSIHEDVSFTISNLDEVTNGSPSGRYIEEAVVAYDDGSGSTITLGTYSALNGSTANVSISGSVVSVTVSLQDGYDGNAPVELSISLGNVSSCDTGGACPDDDGDGVCNSADVCPGFDDTIDSDGDGIPDGCDNNNCTPVTDVFPTDPLLHNGSGATSTTLTYSSLHEDVSFTITNLDAVTNGSPNGRYIEEAVVTYDDGSGSTTTVGTYSGANGSTAAVNISGTVSSVTVALQDGYDGNAPVELSINLGDVSSCVSGSTLPEPPAPTLPKEQEVSIKGDITLFPNPVTDRLTVQFELLENTDLVLVITDVNGRTLQYNQLQLDKGKQAPRIDVSQLPEGMYLLHLQSEKEQSTRKFIVLR